MNILVACEESQTVCKAFRERGFSAYSCDVQDPSGGHPEWHIKGDALEALRGGRITTMDGQTHTVMRWDLVVAHPPCTYLSNAGACRLYPKKGVLSLERYIEGLKAKLFFFWFYIYGYLGVGPIVIENPTPSKIYELPAHSQAIQPYEYDTYGEHPYTKKTLLWSFGLPLLKPTTPDEMPVGPYVPSGTGRKDRTKYGAAVRGDDAKNRSKFFRGVADAFAKQYGDYIMNKFVEDKNEIHV